MSNLSPAIQSHSADVRLSLLVGDRALDVAKASPTQITLRSPVDLDPCDAELVMSVDGREHRWLIRLPRGAARFNVVVPIEDLVAQPTASV
jgi:hypothetical protein